MGLWGKNHRTSGRNTRQNCQNSILRARVTFWGVFFEKENKHIVSGLWGKTNRTVGGKKSGSLSKFLRLQRNDSRRNIFLNRLSFVYHFEKLRRKSFGIEANQFQQSCQSCILRAKVTFWGVLFEKENKHIVSELWAKAIRTVGRKTSGSLSKFLRLQRNHSRRNIFLNRLRFVYHFEKLSKKNFGIEANLFQQKCQNCILRLQRKHSMIVFRKNYVFSHRFWILSKKIYPTDGGTFLTSLSKT